MRRKVKRVLLITAILAGAIVLSIGMSGLREPPAKSTAEQLDPLVEVLELKTMTASFIIESQGNVRPRTETVLSSEVSGTIVDVSPKWIAGGVFDKGEVLMRIDPTNYVVAVDQAKALVRQRQIEFDGAEKLLESGYRAESEHASAAAALASAQAELVRANRNLQRTYIRLPFAGMVRSKEADLAQFVNPGTRLGVVFATDFAEVRLPLTDQDLRFLSLPGAADIRESGDGEGPIATLRAVQKGKMTEWQARVVRTEGVVDEKSRVTYAVAMIEDPYQFNGDGNVLPMGTFVSAEIQGSTTGEVIRVPRSALRGARQLLIVDSEDKIHIRDVNIIRSDSDFAYVQGGAEAGERICLTALGSPVTGMKVRTIVVDG